MYYKLNENKEISITCDKEEVGFLFTDEEIVPSYDRQKLHFKHETETKEYIEAQKQYLGKKLIDELRYRRTYDCFPIINRGQLWHTRLTDEQKAELDAWYDAWLNVTDTLQVPTKPAWLN